MWFAAGKIEELPTWERISSQSPRSRRGCRANVTIYEVHYYDCTF